MPTPGLAKKTQSADHQVTAAHSEKCVSKKKKKKRDKRLQDGALCLFEEGIHSKHLQDFKEAHSVLNPLRPAPLSIKLLKPAREKYIH